MSSKIVVFYHGVFVLGGEFSPHAFNVIQSQMATMQESGLTDTAEEIYVGINGDETSAPFAETVFPEKAVKVYHGPHCRNELRTIMLMQKTMAGRPGYKVLYFHSKGASHDPGEKLITNWRNCQMNHLVSNWILCVNSLNSGVESVGVHWLEGQVDGTMSLWAGNAFWIKSEFLHTLPPIENNARIPLMGGIDSAQSRFEAEVLIGAGPRMPKIKDLHRGWPFVHKEP